MGSSSSTPIAEQVIRIDLQDDMETPTKGKHDLLYQEGRDGSWDVAKPEQIRAFMTDPGIENVVVYVHGHNDTRDEAESKMQRMVPQIGKTFDEQTKSRTRYLCLTWNSRCNINHAPPGLKRIWRRISEPLGLLWYMDDTDKVTYATEPFTYLMNDLAKSGKKLHIIGHSMGCQAVISYLAEVSITHTVLTRPFFQGDPRRGEISRQIIRNIRTVSLLAPDVPTHRVRWFFKEHFPLFWNNGGIFRLSFISNNWDLPIRGSEMLRMGSSRAGIPRNIRKCLTRLEPLKLKEFPADANPATGSQYDRSPVKVCNAGAFRAFGHGVYANRKAQLAIGDMIRESMEYDKAQMTKTSSGPAVMFGAGNDGCPDACIPKRKLTFQYIYLKRK